MKDFNDYLFRCSALGNLMVEGRANITDLQLKKIHELSSKAKLTDKQSDELTKLINKRDASPELSETTKAYLLEVWIKEVYNRQKDTLNKYTEKGLFVEQDSLDLAGQKLDTFLLKNDIEYSNNYIKGTPDALPRYTVIDVKSSWDIFTFASADGSNKNYYWQLQGYMHLTSSPIAKLIYCLVSAPEHLIASEKNRKMYQLGLYNKEGTPEFDEFENMIERNMSFDDISPELRTKIFNFEYNHEDILKLEKKIVACRSYLNSLSL